MRVQRSIRSPYILLLSLVLMIVSGSGVQADDDPPEDLMMFSVTIQNLATGQPLSPPIVATHKGGFKMFRVGRDASTELEYIARDGDQMPMYHLLNDSQHVFDVVDVGVPLAPGGSSVGGFTDSVTFMIQGRDGDKMSLASMLICSNDGFVGLDRVKLPKKGSDVFIVHPFDAGVEDNTEMSPDIVDACSALGPLVLTGDPNGNENQAVNTVPRGVITAHGGVLGTGDLGAVHQIPAGAVKVTVTRVSGGGIEFSSVLKGVGEVPIVLTDASGEARFKLDEEDDGDDDGDDDDGDDDEDLDFGDDWFADLKDARVREGSNRGGRHDRDELEYKLKVKRITGVTGAHIHLGLPDMNGPVVADLYGPKEFSDPVEGDLSRGILTEADLDGGPFEGDFAGFIDAMGRGELYVNVHTAEFPSGEIRGQIGVRKAKEHDDLNRPPTGEIISPEGDVTVAPGESVFFEGTAEDPDGDEVEVLWDFGDGETSSDLSPGDYTYEDAGTYTVTLTATDDQGLSDPTPDTRMITVGGGANRPPEGTITSPEDDVTIAVGESVFFEGMVEDPDGDPVTVLWDFGDGGSSTDLSPGDYTYEDQGTYTVTFTATDDQGNTDPTPHTRTITVEGDNQPPEGVITSPAGDETIAAGESVFFEGTADDPDGDPVTVMWDFGDGGSSTDLSPGDYTYEDPGTYTVTFTATDDQGNTDPTPDTRTITVEGENQPPEGVITAPAGNETITAGESVFFEGTADDPDGDPVTVLWDFGDGGSSTDLSPGNYTYDNPGTYTVTFTATDDQGNTDPTPDTRTITVEAVNQPPEGVITSPAGNVTIDAGGSVSFAGMASDPDGDPVTVLWDFGDGMTSTQMSPGNHTYDDAGTYTVTFTATDDQGLSDPTPDTRTITVEALPPAVTLTELQTTIFTPSCSGCHGGSSPEADLNLSAGQSHGDLVNVAATTEPGVRVIPFDPDNSVLVTFLDDGHRNRPASERLQIRSWINAGAQDN